MQTYFNELLNVMDSLSSPKGKHSRPSHSKVEAIFAGEILNIFATA